MGSKIINSFLWRFAERCGAQIVTFTVSIILARILAPEDYGTIALVTVFTNIMQVFVDSGLGTALIQKKEADELDFSSVFYFNILICCALYGIMFLMAPVIASFYHNTELIPLIRFISLTIVISGVKGIQQAYVTRNMLFRRFFYSTLGGTIFSAFLGIWMAYQGFGAWAIAVQQLSNTAVDTLILWITVKWRPRKVFSLERLEGLLGFGWKMLVSSLLDTGYNNLRSLIIGKRYSSADLAYYDQGNHFPTVIITNINSSIDSVLLPAMAGVQEDWNKVKEMTRLSIKVSTYIMAPLMMGLVFCAEPIVRLILTDKWLACVPFLRIFGITYMFYPIHTANLNAIKAMGRSDYFLRLEIIKKLVGLALLLATMRISVLAMAYSMIISSILCQIINSWPNRKLLHYSYTEQLVDILPSILLAVGMGILVGQFNRLGLPAGVTLLLQVPAGAGVYVFFSWLLHLEEFAFLWKILIEIKGKRADV